jgi:ribonuclease III
MINRFELEKVLRYIKPRNIDIYQTVFVHKSSLKKNQNATSSSNERLEFLGDVVFGLVVTDYLYTKYPNENEGFLTKMRIKIVKGSTLARFARYLDIGKYMILSPNTVVNDNILENAFEALIGAIYLDFKCIGYELLFVKTFVNMLLKDLIDWNETVKDDNYKDILMRYAQRTRVKLPQYNILEQKGTSHSPKYCVTLSMTTSKNELLSVTKESNTKKNAEQLCARDMLQQLDLSQDVYLIK